MRFVGLITFTTDPQVLFDRLVGNWIQFAIPITIHQFYSFFTVHLLLLTDPSRQIFPELGTRAGEPRHDRTRRNRSEERRVGKEWSRRGARPPGKERRE